MKKLRDRLCLICRERFTPVSSTNTLCSLECKQERKRRVARDWYNKPDNRRSHIDKVWRRKHVKA